MRKVALFALALVAVLMAVMPAFAQRPSVVDYLSNDEQGRFTTLVAAIEAAGLVETAAGLEDFTLLAPTNEAFDALLAYLRVEPADLLAQTDLLTQVLTYHVIPSRARFAQVSGGAEVASIEGSVVTFSKPERGPVQINGTANLVDVDNFVEGGIVHVIDAVILPPAVAEAVAANRSNVRVAHLSPDAGAVDVYLDGEVALEGVAFGAVSDYLDLPAGSYNIGIAAAGGEVFKSVIARVPAAADLTIAAIGVAETGDLKLAFIADDLSPLGEGQARVTVFHAIDNAPAVDVLVNDAVVTANLAYPGDFGDNDGVVTFATAAATVDLAVTVAGDAEAVILEAAGFVIPAGQYTMVIAAGTPANPQVVVKSVPVDAE